MKTLTFPQKLDHIPQSYLAPKPERAGKLVDFYYDTYESFSYAEHSRPLRKHAVVYLPYGYSPAEKYNVFYLMHGGWSDETTYLGTSKDPHPLKNILDNGIADGKITPQIVVCPTYNNLSGQDSSDYGLALQLTNNYHHELVNDLLPAVEGRFSTYAADTSADGLKAARDHRAFVGFSMGSVTTWHTFQYALAYFRYFMPSSGGLGASGRTMAEFVRGQGFGPQDFFIFAASGSADFAYSGFTAQIQTMVNDAPEMFSYADNEADGNLYYLVAPGGTHGPKNALEDFYNSLIQLWKEE